MPGLAGLLGEGLEALRTAGKSLWSSPNYVQMRIDGGIPLLGLIRLLEQPSLLLAPVTVARVGRRSMPVPVAWLVDPHAGRADRALR